MSLVDLETIRQLKSRYFRLLDTKQWAAWRELFADDATFDVEGQPPLDSADEWVRTVSSGLVDAVTVHQGHMPEIDLTGPDSARGVWSVQTHVELSSSGPRSGWQTYGHYVEDYRRIDGAWKIASLRLTRLRFEPLEGERPPIANTLRLGVDAEQSPVTPTSDEVLVELEAISQLKARYFRMLDAKDWNAWRSIFVDDARFDMGPIGDVVGADTFVDLVSENLAGTVTVHHGHMPALGMLAPDRATGIWALNDHVLRPETGMRFRGFGHYQEEYTKTSGAWRISSLRLSYLRVDAIADRPWSPSPLPRLTDGWLDGGQPADVARLADLEAIRRLKARYFRVLDAEHWDEFRSLFTADVVVSMSRLGDATEDLDSFVATLSRILAGAVTVHHGHMPEIVFTGADSARGIWALYDHLEWPDTSRVFEAYGNHEDEYRREAGVWKIARIRLSRLHEDRFGW